MTRTVQYFLTPNSPWTYLGHERFCALARRHALQVELLPADYGAVFAATGGLPLGKRAPQRQAYRLVELRRFRDHLGLPLNLQPRYFPVDPRAASLLLLATDERAGTAAALTLAGAMMKGVWAGERDLASPATLAQMLAECGLDAALLDAAAAPALAERLQANTQRAIEAGVFGAPSYVLDGEIFWGQDRLDFLERALAAPVAR